MELIKKLIDLVLHLDRHLDAMIQTFGPWLYVILFLIIFCETGLVVTPILPGDSLLFAVGALSARPDGLNLPLALALLSTAAILGDTVNYWIGAYAGPKVFHKKESRWFNPKHLERAHAFYEKYGGKTIIIARFVPIIRTFAPFVAGIGRMTYTRFLVYNVSGGLLWVGLCILGGYFFGNLPLVKENFSLVIIGIIIVSMIPVAVEYLRHQFGKKASVSE
jgi:membrane-associated protein